MVAAVVFGRQPAFGDSSAERPRINWFMGVYLVSVLLMYINGERFLGSGPGRRVGSAGQAGDNGSVIWPLVVAIGAAAILLSGGYNVFERVSIGLVFTFTLITIACTVLLQWTGYAVTWDDIPQGLEFPGGSPNPMAGARPLRPS
ncbi:MAG: hypothetical protein Ct9H300mP1_16190 [Planctomycetaceae bacterium]|nr:MAG: hypothetical protein Ct9H300mP1_16190 [Planctomycetaceae bacterium]